MRRAAGVVVLLIGVFAAGLAAAGIHAGSDGDLGHDGRGDGSAHDDGAGNHDGRRAFHDDGARRATTLPAPRGTAVTPAAHGIAGNCLLVGGLALLEHGGAPRVLGPVAEPPKVEDAGSSGIAYPADGSIATTAGINLQTNGCSAGRAANGYAGVHALSLFGGAITARTVELSVRNGKLLGSGAIGGLAVGGKGVAVQPGRRVPVEDWGYVVAGDESVSPAAALAVHLTAAHSGLPAGNRRGRRVRGSAASASGRGSRCEAARCEEARGRARAPGRPRGEPARCARARPSPSKRVERARASRTSARARRRRRRRSARSAGSADGDAAAPGAALRLPGRRQRLVRRHVRRLPR